MSKRARTRPSNRRADTTTYSVLLLTCWKFERKVQNFVFSYWRANLSLFCTVVFRVVDASSMAARPPETQYTISVVVDIFE